MKKKILLLLSLLLPVTLWAHPGHDHTGSTLDVISHFLTTYWYAYLIPVVLISFYLMNRKKAKQKS